MKNKYRWQFEQPFAFLKSPYSSSGVFSVTMCLTSHPTPQCQVSISICYHGHSEYRPHSSGIYLFVLAGCLFISLPCFCSHSHSPCCLSDHILHHVLACLPISLFPSICCMSLLSDLSKSMCLWHPVTSTPLLCHSVTDHQDIHFFKG